jgi:hypothetical protein
MCEFCEGDKPIHENLKHRVIGMIRFIRVKKRKWGPCLSISTATNYNGTKQNYFNINYCPMCGRKLTEADDGNDKV